MISLEKLKEFREHILDLAIRGKLVEQRPEEGTAEYLYQQIQEEKQNLIKEGKLKKEKPLAPIEDDEIPFDIPEDWKWVRLRSIVFNHGQKTPNQNFMYIEINSIDNTTQKLTNDINIVTPEKAPSRARKIVCEGDILYATVRPYLHNMCIVEGEFQYEPIASTGFAVMTCIKGVLNKYLFYSLLSPFFDKYANDSENSKGISYPAINDEKLYKALIPLPPLAEQKSIVAKVENYLSVIEKAEELLKRKFDLDGQIKEKILQMAIQGKLVEQRPEEGTAEYLYQQIQEEKQNLIKEGKLKKEKPLAPIEDDEIPFDIPEDWKWVRLRSIVFNHGQKTPNQNFMYIEINSIDNTTQKLTNDINIVTPEKAPSRARKIVCEGDILYATVRPYLHNMCIVEGEFQYEPIASTGFAVMTCIKGVLNKYLFYSLLSPFFDKYANDSENSKGISYPAINDEKLYKALIPLPPLAEQKRIVAKVEELLALCDKLKLK